MKSVVVEKQNPGKFTGGVEVGPVDSGSGLKEDEGLEGRV